MAKDVENTENRQEIKCHLQSYRLKKKKITFYILVFFSFQTFFNVNINMFSKTEIIPTFTKHPTCTRYYSRHFGCIISDSYNNPAKREFVFNIVLI